MEDSEVKMLERKVHMLEKKIEKIKKWIWLKFENEIPDELLQDDEDVDKSLQIVQTKSLRPRFGRASQGIDDNDDDLEIISEIPQSSSTYDNNFIQIDDDDDDDDDDGDIQIIDHEQEHQHQTDPVPVIVSTETICDPLELHDHDHHSSYQNQQQCQETNNLYISGEARIIDTATIIGNNHQQFTNHDIVSVNDGEMFTNLDPLSIDLPINRVLLPPSNPLPDIHQTNEIFTTTQNLIDNVIDQSLSNVEQPEPEPEHLNFVEVKNEGWVQQNYQFDDSYYQEGEGEGVHENNELDQNDYEYYENQNEYYQEEQEESEVNPQEYLDVNYVPSPSSEQTNNNENYTKDSSGKNQPTRRTRFTQRQLDTLRKNFKSNPYVSSEECSRLSEELNLSHNSIRFWFNRQRNPTNNPSTSISNTTKDKVKNFIRNRLSYSDAQLKLLRDYFNNGNTILTPKEAEDLSQKTGLSKFNVYRWFKNKRGSLAKKSARSANNTTTNSNITKVNETDNDTITLNYQSEESDCEANSTENPNKKRKRIKKTESQIAILKKYFYDEGIKYLEINSEKLETVSTETNLPKIVVYNWFVNTKRKEDNLEINNLTINSDSGAIKLTQQSQDNDNMNYYNNDKNDDEYLRAGGDDDHGTRKRTKFSDSQLQILRKRFEENNSIVDSRAVEISQETGLPLKTIRIWYRNKNYALSQDKAKNKDNITIKSVYSVSNDEFYENSNSSSTSQNHNYNYNIINDEMSNVSDGNNSESDFRKKRTKFTSSQLTVLRKYYYDEGIKHVGLGSDQIRALCNETSLKEMVVYNWFNNKSRFEKESMDQNPDCDTTKRTKNRFSNEQLKILWAYYNKNTSIDFEKAEKISSEIGGVKTQAIINWFRHRNYLIGRGFEVRPNHRHESSKSSSVSSVKNSTAASSSSNNESTWYTSSSNFDDFNDSSAKRSRTTFTEDQVKILWGYFNEDQKNFDISDERIERVSHEIELPQKIVLNWFKNKNYQIQKGTVVYPNGEQGPSPAPTRSVFKNRKRTNSLFTDRQVAILVAKFKRKPNPDMYEYEDIAEELGSNFKAQSIRNWFQNQRSIKKKSRSTIPSSSITRRRSSQNQNEAETESEVEVIENTTSNNVEPDTTTTQDQVLSDSQSQDTKKDDEKMEVDEKPEKALT